MVKPELKRIGCVHHDVKSYTPEIPGNFHLYRDLFIGPEGEDSADMFGVGVCTVRWLAHHLANEKCVHLTQMLLVENFDIDLIEKKVRELISTSARPTWNECSEALSRHFYWEFTDYRA